MAKVDKKSPKEASNLVHKIMKTSVADNPKSKSKMIKQKESTNINKALEIKKYSGTIIWYRADYFNEATISADLTDDRIIGQCSFNGTYNIEVYNKDAKKPNYFSGKISKKGEEMGSIDLWKFFGDNNQLVFKGEWKEDNIPYTCYIHLY
jgi:hypothetical protein